MECDELDTIPTWALKVALVILYEQEGKTRDEACRLVQEAYP